MVREVSVIIVDGISASLVSSFFQDAGFLLMSIPPAQGQADFSTVVPIECEEN